MLKTIKSYGKGMSSFSFVPIKGVDYVLRVTKGQSTKTFKLPLMHPKQTIGATMQSEPFGVTGYLDSQIGVSIQTSSSFKFEPGDSVYLTISRNYQTVLS